MSSILGDAFRTASTICGATLRKISGAIFWNVAWSFSSLEDILETTTVLVHYLRQVP